MKRQKACRHAKNTNENRLVKMAVAILRLKCKEMPKKYLLVYEDGWTVQKSLLHEQKLQKPLLEIPMFQFASRLKIQEVGSFLTVIYYISSLYCLRKLNRKYRKTGVYIHFFFPSKNSSN